jgi:bifunctional non-homologous end joining protein LigD
MSRKVVKAAVKKAAPRKAAPRKATKKAALKKPASAGGKLKTYRDKRDFTKTAEPSGDNAVKASELRRFVIQKHAATRLHYDFRLELDGVFKSWAVTRGPSLDPQDKRLAVEVEDHPLDYGDFEGTIPKGEYGGGSVLLWDRGYWAPELQDDPAASLKKGELKFVLDGEKLKGGFVLVRMKRRNGEKRDNWLLIKHHDQFAKDNGEAILGQDKSVASGRSLEQITKGVGKSPKAFMLKASGEADAVWHSKPAKNAAPEPAKPPPRKPVKKSAATPMPDFIAPQLCTLQARAPSTEGWGHEMKLDGYRMQMRVEDGEARLRTRTGLDWTDKFSSIAEAGAALPDCIVDGEVCALDDHGATHFSALQAALSDGDTQSLIFFAFDLLWLSGVDLRGEALSERKALLETMLGGAASELRYVPHFEVSGEDMRLAVCEMALEGVVSKKLDAPYRSGRTEAWVKSKCRAGQEVVVGGWSEEKERFRSLLVGVWKNDALIYAGRVGTGYNQRNVAPLVAKLKRAESKTSPFTGDNAPRPADGVHFTTPLLVAEIEFAGWTDDDMVRQAAFKGLREDKPAKSVVREAPMTKTPVSSKATSAKAIAKATPSKMVPAKSKASRDPSILGVTISHPDKVLWQKTETTPSFSKRDLALYFEAIGDWMLPHIKGRPASILRAPDGIEAELFFQRHAMRGASPLIHEVKVAGDKQPYLQFDSVEALVAGAQIAALEIHPWNGQTDRPELAGRLVFDLDPAPDVKFLRVIEAAKEIKDRLAALGLESFCKTTGGKGLHVVTPLSDVKREGVDWRIAKAFAQAICNQMAADAPQSFLTSMAKKDRGGKIFLDYLRNDRTSTAVAPLSPRARPGGAVSMPLNWAQVRSGLDPTRYTLETAPVQLRKTKPWADYDAERPPLLPIAKKLSGAAA